MRGMNQESRNPRSRKKTCRISCFPVFLIHILLPALALAVTPTPTPTPTPPPTGGTFPIRNGKLQTDLNANGFRILNIDIAGSGLGGGGGGGGGGPSLISAGTMLGNVTSGTAAATELTPAQIKQLLALDLAENTALSAWAGSNNITTLGAITSGNVPAALLTGNMAIARFAGGTNATGKTWWNGAGAWLPLETQQTLGDANTAMAVGATVMMQSPAMTTNRSTVLRPANEYPSGKSVLFIDGTTGSNALIPGNFGRTFTAATGDTILATVNPPFIAGGINGGISTAKFESDGVNTWRLLDSNQAAYAFQDRTDRTKQVLVDVSGQTPGAPTWFRPATAGDSVSVTPEVAFPGYFATGLNPDGSHIFSLVQQSNILPNEFAVGDADATIQNDGTLDTVKIGTALTGTRTYTWPDVSNYASGEKMTFYDATGSLTASTYAHVVGTNGNTFNGNTSIDISMPYFSRTFVADPTGRNWSISNASTAPSNGGLAKAPWLTVTPAGAAVTLPVTATAPQSNFIVPLSSGTPTAVTFSLAQPGDQGWLKFRQDGTGGRTITMPPGTKTEVAQNGGTAGALTLTSAASAEDEFHWDFDGTNYNIVREGLNMSAAAVATFTTVSDQGGASTSGSLTQGDINNSQLVGGTFVACGTSTTCLAAGTAYTIGKVDMRLWKVGAPTFNGSVAIYTDNAVAPPGDQPLAQVGTASTGIAVSGYGTTEATVTFTGLNATLTAGAKYWIVYKGDATSRTFSDVAVTSGSTTITSPSFAFVSGDVGLTVPATTQIPATNIASVSTGTAVLALAATATLNPATVTFGPGNSANYTRWAYTTVTASSAVRKGTTASWVNYGTTRQLRFTLYK